MTKKIVIAPYNSNWPKIYTIEAAKIQQALGNNCIEIHHIGSTAVPRLIAKPRIDIIAAVKNSEITIENLAGIGFEYMGEYNIPMHYGFRIRENVDVNLHIYAEDHPEIELNIMFRDYLRNNPATRDAYATLKQDLLQDHNSMYLYSISLVIIM